MNSCGDCTVCCEAFSVDELNKPKNTPCLNCKGGCTIYESRPQVCRNFKCAYLVGGWNKSLRPDKCGAIIINTKDGYEAFRIKDKVSEGIMKQIQFIEKKYKVKIKGVDARSNA